MNYLRKPESFISLREWLCRPSLDLKFCQTAIMYEKGIGVKRNPAKAKEYYEKAKVMVFDTEKVTR